MAPESSKSFHQLVFTSEKEIIKISTENQIDPDLLGKIKVKVGDEYVNQWLVCNMPIEEFIAERKEIAKKFRVSDLKTLRKKEGHWYINSMTTDEWLEEQRKIEREDDIITNSGGHYRPK